jgi:diguanylate cyclase (GGDEF)-like protein/putative nucleotidyltransferase with HDIG domain
MGTNERGELGRGRGSALAMMLFAVILFAASIGIATVQRENHRTERDSELAMVAAQEKTVLESYFERARSVVLLTAQNQAFGSFYDLPGSRWSKVERNVLPLRRATAALAFLESLYRGSVGEACFIDKTGAENARVVDGRIALPGELSTTERKNPFFLPSFALEVGQTYQAEPYVSPDTGDWVISNSALVPTSDGTRQAIVHFEVAMESFRQAAAAADLEGDVDVEIVDVESGQIMIDGDNPQLRGAPLGSPDAGAYSWLASHPEARGAVTESGRRAAFVRLQQQPGNANNWAVVASDGQDGTLLTGVGLGTLVLALAAILLFVMSMFSYREHQDELTHAALTDVLTGLGNRRRLLMDLEKRFEDETPFALAMYDLDGFKAYNDDYGHQAGDALLARLGSKLKDAAGKHARAYRLGGDEFCLLVDAPGAPRVELIAAGSVALSEEGDGFTVGASYGAVGRGEAEDPDELLNLADRRMYAEKQGRRLTLETQSRDVLLRALEMRYPELLQHRNELAGIAEQVAQEMGLPAIDVSLTRRAAELHDIGKVAVPDSILRKPGELTEDELAFVRRHSELGERILDAAPSLAPIGRLIRAHHERWDGTGYPDRLIGTAIPIAARIVAVMDAYHAMLMEDRPHRARLSAEEALSEIRAHAGSQFDPDVVEAFARVLSEPSEPAHSATPGRTIESSV